MGVMSNNLKHLKEQIEKYADEFDLPPSRPSHAAGVGGQLAGQTGMQPPHRGGSAKPGGGGVPQGNLINDVIKMQDQLINLANTVVKESGPFNVTPQQQTTRSKESSASYQNEHVDGYHAPYWWLTKYCLGTQNRWSLGSKNQCR